MNARQKAKYWKNKYQELASVPVPIKNVVSERRITTISYTKVINDEIYKLGLDSTESQKMILGEVMNGVAERAKNFVDITVERDIYNDGTRITGRLAIAEPFHDYHDVLPMYEGEWRNEYDKRRSNKSP